MTIFYDEILFKENSNDLVNTVNNIFQSETIIISGENEGKNFTEFKR